ncbi:MAG TPA: mechanosensitive ion channel domain-containing protein [Candidatus Sulfotelmatobacter sp.]
MRASLESKILIVMVLVAGAFVVLISRGSSLIDLAGANAHRFLTLPLFDIGRLAVTPVFLLKALLFLGLLTAAVAWLRVILYHQAVAHTAMGQEPATCSRGFVCHRIDGRSGIRGDQPKLSGHSRGHTWHRRGLGLQSIVANWVAGLVLLVEQPVRIGDRVDVGGTNGVAVRIGGRSTWVRTYDNEVIIVPNSDFTSQRLTNWTVNDERVRLSIPVGVAYNSDPKQVRDLLLNIASEHTDVLQDPTPEVVIVELGDSSLNFLLRFWTVIRAEDNFRIKSDLYFSVLEKFGQEGIEVPYPQQDLHLRSVVSPIVVASSSAGHCPGAIGGIAEEGERYDSVQDSQQWYREECCNS